jgi:hypothetical protein
MSADFYHCQLKAIGRSSGRSAVACAAYRTGERIEDVRYGTVRDFSRKADVVTSFTVAPEGAPAWATDTAQLWNAVEAKENRRNSQLAFEWETALPNELSDAQREALAREFADWLTTEYGVAVTVGIHSGGSRGNGLNDHMHVMMTTRAMDADGWGAKVREFATKPGAKNAEVERVREHVADLINDALADAGSDTRVDHRSFKARGIFDREPTKHLGPAATACERRGEGSDRGDINRSIRSTIEERLRWQMEQAQPEITADLEREFSARWESPPAPAAGPALDEPAPERRGEEDAGATAPLPEQPAAATPEADAPAVPSSTEPATPAPEIPAADPHAERAQAHARRYEEATRQEMREALHDVNRRGKLTP